jgi:hypothetical protein
LIDWLWDLLRNGIDWLQSILPYTVSPLELLWSIPLAYSTGRFGRRWVNSDRARRQLRAARVNGAIDIISTKRWIMNGCLFVTFESLLSSGILAMTVPPGPSQDMDSSYALAGVLTAVFLFLAAFTLTLMGELMDANIRRLYRFYARPVDLRTRSTD